LTLRRIKVQAENVGQNRFTSETLQSLDRPVRHFLKLWRDQIHIWNKEKEFFVFWNYLSNNEWWSFRKGIFCILKLSKQYVNQRLKINLQNIVSLNTEPHFRIIKTRVFIFQKGKIIIYKIILEARAHIFF